MHKLLLINTYTSHFTTGYLAVIGAGIGIVIGFVFGSVTLFYVLFGLLVLDIITGVCASLVKGDDVNSTRFRDTTYKVIAYMGIILACLGLSLAFPVLLWAHLGAVGLCIASEAMSVLENCEHILGRKLPFLGKLQKALKVLTSKGVEK